MCQREEPLALEPDACQASHKRRHFLRVAATAAVAWFLIPMRKAAAKEVAISIAKIEKLKTVGASANIKILDREILIVRDSETSVHAINPQCTHKKCQVLFKNETGKLHCKCHKSSFDLNGTVLSGPAPKPLQIYPATLTDEKIVLTLPDEA